MKKIYLSLIICLIFSTVFSQEKIASFKNHLKTNGTDIKDVIPIVNTKNDELAMFIVDAKKVYAYKLNDKFKVTDELSSETKKRKYKVLLGSSINGNDYRIFLSNKEKKKYASINFSFTNKKTVMNEFKFPNDEVFIQTISHLNNFYLLVASNIIGKLYLYSFDEQGNPKKNEINLNGNMLVDKKNNLKNITDLLLNSYTGFITANKTSSLKKIEKDTPNSIESVSEAKKMYVRGNNIVITFDNHKKITQVISINIDTKELIKKTFNKPLENIKARKKKTNSFLYEDSIFLIAGTKEVFSMYITDYNTGKFIKEYSILKDENISFKNSPIIQEGGYYNSHREFEKTKKFLRKITSEKIGISIIKNKDNNYQFTIGGYAKQASGGGMMGGFGGIPMASFGAATVFFNPTMLAYNSFANTKSTRIECVFNQKFEHIKDVKAPKNVFDKIKKAPTPNKAAETVFRYKDYFIKGDNSSFGKTYTLRKFTN